MFKATLMGLVFELVTSILDPKGTSSTFFCVISIIKFIFNSSND